MPEPTINQLFPEDGRLLLTGSGKDFIERIGVEAARQVVLGVLKGENVRTQTEPLTRRRIAQVSGALVALFTRGLLEVNGFSERLSEMAVRQIQSSRRNDAASLWPAQWLIGLTGKSVQNVLRGNSEARAAYLADFEAALTEAAEKCRASMGQIEMTLGFVEDASGQRAELDWKSITRLMTAVGSATLTIRGSDKSIYGKLFERLVLGSVLSILGFTRVNRPTPSQQHNVFWLSDSSDLRECDATVLLEPGRLARFDIGFIGPGNSEISKDKLTRYANEVTRGGSVSSSLTFIIVDRLPRTGKTEAAAANIGAEIIQMSMQYWPRDLAQRLQARTRYRHELSRLSDSQMSAYLEQRLQTIPIQDFLQGVSVADLAPEAALPDAADEIALGDEDE